MLVTQFWPQVARESIPESDWPMVVATMVLNVRAIAVFIVAVGKCVLCEACWLDCHDTLGSDLSF